MPSNTKDKGVPGMWDAGGGGGGVRIPEKEEGVESRGYPGTGDMSRIWWLMRGRRRRGATTGI
jgi:hypothetical protein